jgi:hypothetical protein
VVPVVPAAVARVVTGGPSPVLRVVGVLRLLATVRSMVVVLRVAPVIAVLGGGIVRPVAAVRRMPIVVAVVAVVAVVTTVRRASCVASVFRMPAVVAGLGSWVDTRVIALVATHDLGALVFGVGQERSGRIQALADVRRHRHLDPGPRRRDLLPHSVDHHRELGPGRTGDGQDIGIGRPGRDRPASAGERGLEREPHVGGAGHGHDEDVRSPGGHPEQERGQVHRSAPSRHA